jgi:endoglucanase
LTFAIEMIDDIYSNNPNQTLKRSVLNALGQSNGTKLLSQIVSKNPQFTKNTTRLEVWVTVGKELSRQGVIVHLDNHISKAFWCCGDNDITTGMVGLARNSSTLRIGNVGWHSWRSM